MPPKASNRSLSSSPGLVHHISADDNSLSADPGLSLRTAQDFNTSLTSDRDTVPNDNSFQLGFTEPDPIDLRAPTRMDLPAKRKAAAPSTQKRITRVKKQPASARKPFEATPLARAHLMTSGPRNQEYLPTFEASTTQGEGAFPVHSDSSLRAIQPKPARVSPSSIPEPGEASNSHCTTLTHGPHPHEPASPSQEIPPKGSIPWYSFEMAANLSHLPMKRRVHFSTYPFTSPRCSLTREHPFNFTAVHPLPKGLENPACPLPKVLNVPPPVPPGPEPLDQINFVRSIVTYCRLGFRFDEIAQMFHRAGVEADIITAEAVEIIWTETLDKGFSPWYHGGDAEKLTVFERDDPMYQLREE